MNNRRGPWLSLLFGMAVVLSGCNASSATPQPLVSSQVKQEEIMSAQERDMVILFQSLVEMDREDGLRFSKQQAKELLPLVSRNSTDGELSYADQQHIIALLSTNQKAYVDHFQEHLLTRQLEKKPLEDLTPEQREQIIREFQNRREENEREHRNDPVLYEAAVDEMSVSYSESLMPGSDMKVPDNVEQQLMGLLNDRLHNESGK